MNYEKLAASLFHTIYPTSNFYAMNGESYRRWILIAKEFVIKNGLVNQLSPT